MADVYRFTLPDGQEHAWHGSVADLRKEHPDARVMGQLVSDELGQGTWEPYSGKGDPPARVEAPTEREAPEKPAKKDK